jgi:hypothetical protein
MSTQTIEFEHRIDEVLTPVISVVLRDAGDAWGLRKVSSGEVILASGTPLAADVGAPGRYTLETPELIDGEIYEYALEWVYNGDTDRQTKTFAAPGALSFEAAQSDIADLIGADNLAIASDMENDEPGGGADVARVNRGLAWARAEITRTIRAGNYFAVPVTGLDADSALTLRDVHARLAAWWLYQNRGIRDTAAEQIAADDADAPPPPSRGLAGLFENHKKIAMGTLLSILRNPRQLVATKRGADTRLVSIGVVRSATCGRLYASQFPVPPL